jgi:hypothetical protein
MLNQRLSAEVAPSLFRGCPYTPVLLVVADWAKAKPLNAKLIINHRVAEGLAVEFPN